MQYFHYATQSNQSRLHVVCAGISCCNRDRSSFSYLHLCLNDEFSDGWMLFLPCLYLFLGLKKSCFVLLNELTGVLKINQLPGAAVTLNSTAVRLAYIAIL